MDTMPQPGLQFGSLPPGCRVVRLSGGGFAVDQPPVLPFTPWAIGQQITGGPFYQTPFGPMQQRWTVTDPAAAAVAAANAEAAAPISAAGGLNKRKAAGGSFDVSLVPTVSRPFFLKTVSTTDRRPKSRLISALFLASICCLCRAVPKQEAVTLLEVQAAVTAFFKTAWDCFMVLKATRMGMRWGI